MTVDVEKMTVDEILRALGPRADSKSPFGRSPYDITHQGIWYQKPDPVDVRALLASQEGGSPPYDDWATGAPMSDEQRRLGYSQIWRNMPGNNREYGVGTPTGELVPGSSFSQNLNQDKNVMLAALAAAGVVTAPMWMGAAAGAGAGVGAGGGGAAGLGAAEAAGAMGGAAGASGGGLTLAQSGGMLGAGGMTGAAGGTVGAAGASPSWINGLSNGQTLGIGANLLGGVMGSNAAGKAADAQLQAGQEANALLREMWQASRADNAPMLDMRNSVLPRIQGLMADPSSITGEPGYQFGLRQGQRALDNKFAASGNYYSGQQLKGATQYAQDYAGTKFDQSLNRLMGVAGMGQVGANNNQAANNNYGTQASSNMTDMGNVRGSGYVGSANAWGNALGGAFNSWQQDEMMRRLQPQRGP